MTFKGNELEFTFNPTSKLPVIPLNLLRRFFPLQRGTFTSKTLTTITVTK